MAARVRRLPYRRTSTGAVACWCVHEQTQAVGSVRWPRRGGQEEPTSGGGAERPGAWWARAVGGCARTKGVGTRRHVAAQGRGGVGSWASRRGCPFPPDMVERQRAAVEQGPWCLFYFTVLPLLSVTIERGRACARARKVHLPSSSSSFRALSLYGRQIKGRM